MADLPPEADVERRAIWARHDMATIAESGEADVLAVRSPTCVAAVEIEAWSEKWAVEQYGIGRPFRTECGPEGHLSYYHLTVPEAASA